jgi:hypothetical protein
MGAKWKYAPLIGVLSCLIWIAYALCYGLWGLQPLNAVSLVIYSRSSYLWLKVKKEK